jgi:hypothetical protein
MEQRVRGAVAVRLKDGWVRGYMMNVDEEFDCRLIRLERTAMGEVGCPLFPMSKSSVGSAEGSRTGLPALQVVLSLMVVDLL